MYDLSTEYLTFPAAAEIVTYYGKANAMSAALTAYRNVGTIREQAVSDAAYFRESQTFFIPNEQVGESLPLMPGDTITDGNDNLYIVQSVSGGFAGSSWQLGTRRLGIQDFGHTVKYVRATGTSSDTTERRVGETEGDSQLAAIQPQLRVLTDMFGTKTIPQTYSIWLASGTLGQAPNPGDMFEDENAVRYEIVEISDRKRIDELSL